MLKFGKIIKATEKKVLNFGVKEFDVESKEWVVLGPVLFLTENAPFGEAGSHYAFKASRKHHKFGDATYVIKRYKTSALENIEILKQSTEIQARKFVQINLLARNVAVPFSDRCATVTGDFSKTIQQSIFWENR